MRIVAFLLLAAIMFAAPVRAQDPCSDAEYLRLKAIPAEQMSEQALLRYLELRKRCEAYNQVVVRHTNPDGPPGTVWFEPALRFSLLEEGDVGVSATGFNLGMGLGVALSNIASVEVGGSFIRESLKPSGFSAASRNGFSLFFGLRIYNLPSN